MDMDAAKKAIAPYRKVQNVNVNNTNWRQFNIGDDLKGSLDGSDVKLVDGVWMVGMMTKPNKVDVPINTLAELNPGIIPLGGRRGHNSRNSRRGRRGRSAKQ